MLPVLTSEPYHKFVLAISTEEFNADEENGLSCQLVFTYTEKYPDTAPIVEIQDSVNFEDNYESRLLEHIDEAVSNIIVINIFILKNLFTFRYKKI